MIATSPIQTRLQQVDLFYKFIRHVTSTYVLGNTPVPNLDEGEAEIRTRFFAATPAEKINLLDYAFPEFSTWWQSSRDVTIAMERYTAVIWSLHFGEMPTADKNEYTERMRVRHGGYLTSLLRGGHWNWADKFMEWICAHNIVFHESNRILMHAQKLLTFVHHDVHSANAAADAIVAWYEEGPWKFMIQMSFQFTFEQVTGPVASWELSEGYAMRCVRLGMRPVHLSCSLQGRSFAEALMQHVIELDEIHLHRKWGQALILAHQMDELATTMDAMETLLDEDICEVMS